MLLTEISLITNSIFFFPFQKLDFNEPAKFIEILFNYLSNKTLQYISKEVLKTSTKERAIADFIAGMTDRYAINLYKKLK